MGTLPPEHVISDAKVVALPRSHVQNRSHSRFGGETAGRGGSDAGCGDVADIKATHARRAGAGGNGDAEIEATHVAHPVKDHPVKGHSLMPR